MAELAAGAVQSLLGVIRNEARLLGRIESDVQFIKGEMESMNSFLLHLSRTVPPGGEHSEQVRTWMKQVRDLAHDCSNSIDLYLQRGDPAIYRARGPLGYLWWIPWYLHKLVAQHTAAIQLRELKARARDVGERRLRYGVEIPTLSDTTTTAALAPITEAASSFQAIDEVDNNEDDPLKINDSSTRALKINDFERRVLAFSDASILKECSQELVNWLRTTKELDDKFPSIAIAAPNEENEAYVAHGALAHSNVDIIFEHKFEIKPLCIPAGPLDILAAIMQKLNITETVEVELTMIKEKTEKIKEKIAEHLDTGCKRSDVVVPLEPLDILHGILLELLPNTQPGETVKHQDATDKWGEHDQINNKIGETAKKVKEHMESWSGVSLDHPEYVGILQELLPKPKEYKLMKEATDTSGNDQITKNIKEITRKIKQDILRQLLPKPQEDKAVKEAIDKSCEDQTAENIKENMENIVINMLREMLPKPKQDKSVKKATDNLGEDQMLDKKIEQVKEKINGILKNIEEHLLMKGMAEKIKEHLANKMILIVLIGMDYAYKWGEIKKALSSLGCKAGSAVVVTTKYPQGSKEFCNPEREPILYSLAASYYKKVLQLTGQRKYKDIIDYNTSIFHDILKQCEPHEFCMKIFVRALYVNPNRNKEELHELLDNLIQESPSDLETNAKIMLKFSYNNLSRDYKTCLLYLAIFPRGHKINRLRLVGRWVVEGLIAKEDWPSSVRQAERCFDGLVDQWLVYPGEIGTAGKVKSCIVHDIVHEFITKKARKEHFVETRLSHHLAQHFSVLSDLRLRSSETMDKFLLKLYKSPKLPLVKVLDLEGCPLNIFNQQIEKSQHCQYLMNIYSQRFERNQHYHYLKNICDKMLLLKYLSLRSTNITMLPKEINNLHQLEVLDIRQTHVPASATKDVLLLKLKRLLAGHIDLSPISTDTGTVRAEESFSSVRIPRRIEKMTNMEVLSNVMASQASYDLKDIGKLWQLRKLGVVINDKKSHLRNLLRAIGDLNECLQSLSITLPKTMDIPTNKDLPNDISDRLTKPPKLLESLSISGITRRGQLLPLLVKGQNLLAKVTLSNTYLNQDILNDLAKLPKLRCIRLLDKSCDESQLTHLTFNKDEFQNLNILIVKWSAITTISFTDGAAPNLEKIAWSFGNILSLSGIDKLKKLKELELNGENIPIR